MVIVEVPSEFLFVMVVVWVFVLLLKLVSTEDDVDRYFLSVELTETPTELDENSCKFEFGGSGMKGPETWSSMESKFLSSKSLESSCSSFRFYRI